MSPAFTRRTLRAGSLAGLALTYLSLVGIVERLDDIRLVEGVLTLGRLLVVAPALVAGYLVARPRVVSGDTETPGRADAVAMGAVAGAVSGASGALLILAIDLFTTDRVRDFLVQATPRLLEVLLFGRTTTIGIAVLILSSAIVGAAGGALRGAPVSFRRPLEIGLTVTLLMSMLQQIFRVMIVHLGIQTEWLYSTRFAGLTYLGALIVLGVAMVATVATLRWKRSTPSTAEPGGSGGSRTAAAGLLPVAGLILLAALPVLIGPFLSAVLGRVGIFLLMGLGLNIVVGYAGLLDLGYVAFFAVGAYATGVLTAAATSGSSIHPGLPFAVGIPLVVSIAILTGLLIGAPVLRLRGDYLAIVTLGFGEIARVLVTSDWLKPLLGGPLGLYAIPAPKLSLLGLHVDFRNPQPFYYIALAGCALAVFISHRLENSRIGRAWMAMREDEQVAEATGVSTVKFKLLAFATGAGIGSLAGALFAVQIGSIAPSSFQIIISIQALAIIILGGMGSIRGVIVGALVLIGLPGFLTEFQDYQLLIYGAALVAIMLLRPQGLLPNTRRTRELLDEERSQDQWLVGGAETPAPEVSGP